MIAYVDSSLVVRALLPDESGYTPARLLLASGHITPITGTWTHIEVAGAMVRATRAGRLPSWTNPTTLINALLGPTGRITTVDAPQLSIEATALQLVRAHGLRAMDAWHLSVAHLTLHDLAGPGQPVGFSSRDDQQAVVARELGLTTV